MEAIEMIIITCNLMKLGTVKVRVDILLSFMLSKLHACVNDTFLPYPLLIILILKNASIILLSYHKIEYAIV